MSRVGPGRLLQLKIRLATPLLDAATAPFWDHHRLPDLFPFFLQTLYGSVRATVPLMETALDVLRRRPGGDVLDSRLIEYFERHIAEETAHDEWLLTDLAAIGIERRHLGPAPPAPIARLVGAQYYWVRHAHPVTLLGFFAVLEGHPPTGDDLNEVQRRTGLPAEAFRMLRYHADEDPGHADDLFRLVDALPLEPWQSDLIGTSALETVAALCALFGWLASQPVPPMVRA